MSKTALIKSIMKQRRAIKKIMRSMNGHKKPKRMPARLRAQLYRGH
ncbi:MAG: hypothetical protein [Siphoviridae sp. ctjeG17]|nr:MAG: hypothetical protein [Siphoviridae sp. ctjeG17]